MNKENKILLKKINQLEFLLCGKDNNLLNTLDDYTKIWYDIQESHFLETFKEINRLLNNTLDEVKNDEQPTNLQEQAINEGWVEALEYSLKTIDIAINNHYKNTK